MARPLELHVRHSQISASQKPQSTNLFSNFPIAPV